MTKMNYGADFSMEAHLAALYAERRRLKRNELTKAERKSVTEEVNERLDAGEDAYDLMEEYGRRWPRGEADPDDGPVKP